MSNNLLKEEKGSKVITADEKGNISYEEIKRVVDLLKYEISDHLSILEELLKCSYKIISKEDNISKTYFEQGILEYTIKIFDNEKVNNESIVNLLVNILRKIEDKYCCREGGCLSKMIDAIQPLYSIMINNKESKIKENAMKSIIIIAKKYPSDVINNNYIKNSYKFILPSNKEYSYEKKKYIFILFEKMMKEGIIKKGEGEKERTEIIEEILFIGEMINKKKDIINIKEDFNNIISDFIKIAKEKGFESKVWKNKSDIISEDIYIEWRGFCKEDCCLENNQEEIIKEEEKEKVKKFCDYVVSHSFDIQILFIRKLCCFIKEISDYPNEYESFKTRRNGLFLYYFLPLFFKMYHFEEVVPKFFEELNDKYSDLTPCYKYIIKLYKEIIERMIREGKENTEMNEERCIIILFLWTVVIDEDKTEAEIDYLINSTEEVFEWSGKLEEEKEEELMKEKDKFIDEIKYTVNIKEVILNQLLDIVTDSCYVFENEREKIKKDRRIGKILLEVVKNHISFERYLIEKGNKKRIIEYIIFSYDNDYDTSNLLSLPFYSFPFSNKTIMSILFNLRYLLTYDDYNELLKKDILMDMIDCMCNFVDIVKIISKYDLKKEIEKEISVEVDKITFNKIKKRISCNWFFVEFILSSYLKSFDLSLFDNNNNKVVKTFINTYFKHNNNNNNYIYNEEKEKEKNSKDPKEMILINPFTIDEENRKDFIHFFLCSFFDSDYYSIFNVNYLVSKSEEGCDIISILTKELSGEIVDRIKKREGNNIKKERRRYERENDFWMYNNLLELLKDMIYHTFINRYNVYLGQQRNINCYKGREKEIIEDKDYISDIIEEEDMRELFIIYLKHSDDDSINISILYEYSEEALIYLFSLE